MAKPFLLYNNNFFKEGLKFFDTVQENQNKFPVKDRNSGFLCSIEISRHQMNSANSTSTISLKLIFSQ